MAKAKYKLGDIIKDKVTHRVEIIVALKYNKWLGFRYKTVYDNPRHQRFGENLAWWEGIIDDYYVKIGNLFVKE